MDRGMRMKTLLFDKLDVLIPAGTRYEDALRILRERATQKRPFFTIFASDTYTFVSPSEEIISLLADYFDGKYNISCITGTWDVLEDLENDECDCCTGMYFVDVLKE